MSNPQEQFPTECIPLFVKSEFGRAVKLTPEQIARAIAEARAKHPKSHIEQMIVIYGVAQNEETERAIEYCDLDVKNRPLAALALIFSTVAVQQIQESTISQEVYMEGSTQI